MKGVIAPGGKFRGKTGHQITLSGRDKLWALKHIGEGVTVSMDITTDGAVKGGATRVVRKTR